MRKRDIPCVVDCDETGWERLGVSLLSVVEIRDSGYNCSEMFHQTKSRTGEKSRKDSIQL